MRRLDERFGEYGWQREHKDVHGVTYCGVSLWDEDKKCWVTKWDAGEPSKTSPQKGEASDSFKRACVNWGIGRELYTAPFIWIKAEGCNIEPGYSGKPKCNDKFIVVKLNYKSNGDIDGLAIKNVRTNKLVFVQMPTDPKNKEEDK
jgi:hypothetical protein